MIYVEIPIEAEAWAETIDNILGSRPRKSAGG